MAFGFDDFLEGRPFGSDENSGGWFTDVFDPLDFTGTKGKNAAAGLSRKQAAEQARWKALQYQLLAQHQAPSWSPEQAARIKALEDESKLNLIEDPAFQGQMRQATGGGAQALAAVQNRQAASGAGGGFQNVGSVADVYDRLGTQLAGLAANQTRYKEQKRDTAANAHQSLADAQTAYRNAQIDAQTAIEAGDHAAISDSMNRMFAAQQAADAALRTNAIGAAEAVFGAFTGNANGVKNGATAIGNGSKQQTAAYQSMGYSSPGNQPGEENYGQGPTNESYSSTLPSYGSSNYFSSALDGGGDDYRPHYQSKRSYY